MEKYSQIYTITGADIDAEYRIAPKAVVALFQDCFANYCASKQLAAFDIIAQDQMWVISDFRLRFKHRLPFWTEQVRVEIWMSEITPLRFYTDFYIYTHDEIIFAEGYSCWNILNASTKRILPTTLLQGRFQIIPEWTLNGHPKMECTHDNIPQMTSKHLINLTDLDFNRHVNNRSYLSIALNTTPIDFLESNTLRTLQVKFHRESFLHDHITCTLYTHNNRSDELSHIIVRNEDQAEICTIISSWEDKKKLISITEYMNALRRNTDSEVS